MAYKMSLMNQQIIRKIKKNYNILHQALTTIHLHVKS